MLGSSYLHVNSPLLHPESINYSTFLSRGLSRRGKNETSASREPPLIPNLSTCSGASVFSLNHTVMETLRLYMWCWLERERVEKKILSRINHKRLDVHGQSEFA